MPNPRRFGIHFDQNAAEFLAVKQQIVRPLQIGLNLWRDLAAPLHAQPTPPPAKESALPKAAARDAKPPSNRSPSDCAECHECPPRPRPAVCSSARNTLPSGAPALAASMASEVRRADLVIVMNMLGEDCALHQRRHHVGQQQVRNCLKLVARCRMPGNVHSQTPQLLDQSPDFRAAACRSPSAIFVPLTTTVA